MVTAALFPVILALGPVAGAPPGIEPARGAPRALELKEALEMAAARDARHEAVALGEQAALFDTAAVWQRMLPSLSAEASITRNAQEVKIGSGADERVISPLHVPRASASTRFALLRGPDLPEAVAAWKRYDAVQAEAAEQRDALFGDVASLFLDLAELVRVEVAAADAASRARGLYDVAESRVRLGEAVPLEAADAEAEALRAEAELAQVRGERAAVEALVRLRLGLDDDRPLVAVCEECVALPPRQALEERGEYDLWRGDIAGLEHRAWAARAQELGGWAGLLPTVEVVGNLQLQQPTLFNPNPVWWTAQLVMRWDIFGPSPTSAGTLRSLSLDRQAALATVNETLARDEASAAVRASRARLRARRTSVRAARARTGAATRALEQAEARYRGGLLSSADVLEVARRKAEADVALARSELDVMRARLELRRALGLAPTDEGARHD